MNETIRRVFYYGDDFTHIHSEHLMGTFEDDIERNMALRNSKNKIATEYEDYDMQFDDDDDDDSDDDDDEAADSPQSQQTTNNHDTSTEHDINNKTDHDNDNDIIGTPNGDISSDSNNNKHHNGAYVNLGDLTNNSASMSIQSLDEYLQSPNTTYTPQDPLVHVQHTLLNHKT